MTIHVLPGESLVKRFNDTKIEGEIIVCRECLISGDVKAETMNEFWNIRTDFITKSFGENAENYYQNVTREFERLTDSAFHGAEINLWFENELFCQVNLWFCLYLLRESESKIYRIVPYVKSKNEVWKGFGGLNAKELKKCFAARIEVNSDNIKLGADLWKAFQNADSETLEELSDTESECFPYLKEVCQAEIEKAFRPKTVLRKIIAEGRTDFADIFNEFSKRAGVYGFGDSQLKQILAEI